MKENQQNNIVFPAKYINQPTPEKLTYLYIFSWKLTVGSDEISFSSWWFQPRWKKY